MKEEPLTGGWEENFNDNLIVAEEENNTIYTFLGVELLNKQRRGNHNACVFDRRSFEAIRNEVVESLINFLHDRLDDESLSSTNTMEPLRKLDGTIPNEKLI